MPAIFQTGIGEQPPDVPMITFINRFYFQGELSGPDVFNRLSNNVGQFTGALWERNGGDNIADYTEFTINIEPGNYNFTAFPVIGQDAGFVTYSIDGVDFFTVDFYNPTTVPNRQFTSAVTILNSESILRMTISATGAGGNENLKFSRFTLKKI